MLVTTALVALSALASVQAQTTYDPQSLAAQLNLTNSFNYTFPAATSLKQYANTSSNAKSAYTRGNNATFSFMRSNWNLYRDFVQFGRADLGFVADPEPKSSSSGNASLALAVQYPAGSYSHATGGAQFYSAFPGTTNSSGISPLSMLLTYSVYFPANYSFVHGGKLPGLRGGDVNGCSGGEKTNGTSCFSSRLMWRDGGAGEGLSSLLPHGLWADCWLSVCVYPGNQQYLRGIQRYLRFRVRHFSWPWTVHVRARGMERYCALRPAQ